MSNPLGIQISPESQHLADVLNQFPALAKLLSSKLIDPRVALDFFQSFELFDFQFGAPLFASSGGGDSFVRAEKNCPFIYLVCSGRIRILCFDAKRQQDVSTQVLEACEFFGADEHFYQKPFPYHAIAATSSQIARISINGLKSWLGRIPQLRLLLEQQAAHRQQLIFFKTLTHLQPLAIKQIQRLLPYLEVIAIPGGTNLAQITQDKPGHFWLYQGKITSQDRSPVPVVGSNWGYPNAIPTGWMAQSDLQLYRLAAEHREQAIAIAPDLFLTERERTKLDKNNAAANLGGPRHLHHALRTDVQTPNPNQSVWQSAKPSLSVVPSPLPGSEAQVQSPESSTAVPVNFPSPQHHRRLRFWHPYPFIAQHSSSDCGVACLAMIGQYWGNRLSLNLLRGLANVRRSGAALKNLAKAAEEVGFHARPVRASLERLAEQSQPWVAHWQGDHYVVVYWVKGDRLLLADPVRGKCILTKKEFIDHWTGYALLLDPTDKLNRSKIKDSQSLQNFWHLLLPHQSVLWQIILASLLIQVFGLVIPLFTQVILDQVVGYKSLSMLHVFAVGLLLFSLWRIALTGVRQYLLDYLSNHLDLTLISGFISHALLLPLHFFESRQVSDIITRVQENQKIQQFLVRQAVSTWLDALMVIVYLTLMCYYNWQLTLLVIAFIPPIVLLTFGATPSLKQLSRETFNATAEQNSLVVEMISGIATVKATAAEQEMRWHWEDHLVSMLNLQFKGQKLANGLQIAGGLINALGSTAVLWYGASLVIQEQLTIGQFVAFNMLIGGVINPILAGVGIWDQLQEVLISVERLNDVFSTEPETTPNKPMLVLPKIRGDIQFDNVTFSYDLSEKRNTLQNLSFEVKSGQTIAVVGRSGSGKTTLVKLLQGLYHPQKGRILIDGHDVRHISPQSLRSQFGVVPQECFLFSGTVLENIQLYRSEFSLEQVIEVAKLAEAHAFIQDLPLGYNTKVGARGCHLSGGQRQRIAIARALLGTPAILMLDEATSSLDTESERRFQQNLTRISRDRTTIIVAHRLSAIHHADCILVLDQGILVEQGNHEELVALRGLYYHLAQQQLNL